MSKAFFKAMWERQNDVDMTNAFATPPPEATIQTIALRTQDTDEADGDAHLLQTLYTEANMSIACPDGVVPTRPRTVLVHGGSCGAQSVRPHVQTPT